MAKLSELTTYLEQGYSLQCVTGTTLHLEQGGLRAPIITSKISRFWPMDVLWPGAGLEDMRNARNSFEYGVLFLDEQGQEYRIDNLAAIEAAMAGAARHPTWGQLPPSVSRKIGPTEVK
jgi:hypothetical protein